MEGEPLRLLEEEEQRTKKECDRLTALVQQQQRQAQALKQQYDMIQGAKQGYLLYIEQFRVRRQPVWWYFLVMLSLVCVFGAYSRHQWLTLGANALAHKLLWRKLYVDTNASAQMVAAAIILFTLLFA